MMPKTIALTGASGFIGRHIGDHLTARGHHVRALTRREPPETAPSTTTPSTNERGTFCWVRGEINDPAAIDRLLAGVDAVIHCAGLVKARRREEFFTANQQAVATLVDRIQNIGGQPPALLHMSSLAAREPDLSPYAQSKAGGEQILRDKGTGFDWLILRPPAVYGPGDFEILKLFKTLRYGLALVPGSTLNRVSVIYVHDLANFACRWIESPFLFGQTIEVDDGTPGGYRMADIYKTAADLLGRPVRTVSIPTPLLTIAAQMNRALGHVSGRALMLTPGKVRELLHPDWVARPPDKEGPLIESPTRLADGLGATLDWYRRKKLL